MVDAQPSPFASAPAEALTRHKERRVYLTFNPRRPLPDKHLDRLKSLLPACGEQVAVAG
ncbi:hypothetical protein SAMN03159406_03821 [Rhizobium sp. NFR03]|nr:hypothetical protein SAMN03159406_03821 [Rhizobium sp. NFR03]